MGIGCLELISVEQPEDYQKESWQMDEQEKLNMIPKLREKGNEEFRQKKFKNASENYAKAIGILEQLMLKYIFIFCLIVCFHFIISERNPMILNGTN